MKTLIDEQELARGVARMAEEIRQRYGDQPLLVIGVLTGGLMLLCDLVRRLEMPLRLAVIRASSYRGEMQRGVLKLTEDSLPEVAGEHVLLVDDIFDTGHTLDALIRTMRERGATSVASAVLLEKSGTCQVEMKPDFRGFVIPDVFVVGYGLDYRDRFRNLPFVAILEPGDLES